MTFAPHLQQLCRDSFPALHRQVDGRAAVFLDGPGGTQVPQVVIDAVSDYLANHNANHGGLFATSRESDAILDAAQQAAADFVGADDPNCVYFGPNMTTLTFALSRAIARGCGWQAGDEVLVTRLDHDANVSPWVLAARDAGATIRFVEIHREDCTLDLDDFRKKLSPRTKLVAVGYASNAVGTTNPVQQICAEARAAGALTFIDAVHFAPHALIDVAAVGCDFLACSAYKFFAPHVGIMFGRRELLDSLAAYKVRPASNQPPGKWMTGTQNHEGLAGMLAAIDYLAGIGRHHATDHHLPRRAALREAFAIIGEYESVLCQRLLAGLATLPQYRVWGITGPRRAAERMPTISITHASRPPAEIAEYLGRRGIFVWHGNYHALELTETLGLEPAGMVRLGIIHYNTADEVDRTIETLAELR